MRARVVRAKVVLILIVLGLALAVTASPVAAADGSFEVQGVGGGFISVDGTGVWMTSASCVTGHVESPDLSFENRFALEFPLTGLPADATITSATLSLHTPAPHEADQTAVYGYVGNGTMEPPDAQATGTPVLFPPTSSVAREDHDVTSLLTPAVVASGWAGFSVRQEPLGTTFANWSCPSIPDLFPVLRVSYTTPDPVVDTDGDGVVDAADQCPDTVVDAFPDLKPNRYSYDGTALVSEFAHNPPYTMAQTGGCSAAQIMVATNMNGPDRFGLGRPKLEAWVASVP